MSALPFPLFISFGAGTPATTDIDAMILAGVKGVRFPIAWDPGDPTFSGTYTESKKLSAIIKYCNNVLMPDGTTGFDVILQVALGATYAGQGYSHNGTGGVNVIQQLSAYVVSVGTFYQGANKTLFGIEPLNEPNHAKFDDNGAAGETASGVTAAQKGARYLEYLARIYPPLHAANPTLKILTAGLGGINDSPTDVPAQQFMTQVYAASVTVNSVTYHGASGLFDIVNFHVYTYYETWTQDLTTGHDRGATNLTATRAVVVANGDGAKPWILTEFGTPVPWQTNTLELGAAILEDACTNWGALSWGGGGGNPLCYFTWQDKTADTTVRQNNFGLIDFAGNKKGALYTKFQALATAVGTPPPTATGFGLNIHPTASHATAVATLANSLWTAAGSSNEVVLRVQPEWGAIQSGSFAGTLAGQNDTFNWAAIDPIVDAHAAAGTRILWIIGYTPTGLGGAGGTGKSFPNRDAGAGYRDVANYAWSLVNHCEIRQPGVTKAVEIWNEPNGTFLLPVSVAKYTAMLKACYTAIKTGAITGRTTRTAYPNILVGTGGCSPETPGTPNAADQWHQGIVANGGTNSFDWAGHHPYGLQCPPTNTASWNQRLHVLPQLRTVLDNAGRTDAEIWLTEDGCFNRPDATATNTGDTANCGTLGSGPDPLNQEVTESESATRIAELAAWYATNKPTYKLGTLCYYQLEDFNDNTHAGDWATHAGIYGQTTAHDGTGTVKTAIRTAFLAALGAAAPARTAPAVSISTPADDASHANPISGNVVFLISATDTVDDPSQLIVKLYQNNGNPVAGAGFRLRSSNPSRLRGIVDRRVRGGTALVGTPTWSAAQGWHYVLDTTTLPDGNYTFAAKALNTALLVTTGDQPNGIRLTINNNVGAGLPAVTSVTNDSTHLASGTVAGGDAIHITGTSFTGTTGATIGGTACTSVVVVDDSTLTAVTPAHAAGTVNTVVTTPAGSSTVFSGSRFTFLSTSPGGAPTVTNVNPNTGPAGTTVTLVGTNFAAATAVKFAGVDATSYTINTPTVITCVSPAGSGPADVTVTNASGTSGVNSADVFVYTAVPTNLVVTVSEVQTAEHVNLFPPFGEVDVDGTITFLVTVTGAQGTPTVGLYEGVDAPYGSNFLGNAHPFGAAFLYSLDTTVLTNGDHTLHFVAKDSTGNTGVS